MRKLLPAFMFFMIFSPKIGGTIDSLSFFCFFVFIISFLIDKRLVLPKAIARPTALFLTFGLTMIAYSFIIKSLNGVVDNYQVLRFGRVIINCLGVFGLMRLYLFYYRFNAYYERVLFHLWVCIILHGTLMLLMFAFSSVNQFVITQLVQMDESNRSFETRFLGQRIGGLTSSWDAASGVQSLGILMLPFVLNYREWSPFLRRLIYLTIPISLVAIFISGVTGLVNIVIVGLILFVFNFSYLRRYIGKSLKVAFILFLISLPVLFFLKANSDAEWIRESSIGRTLFMITQDENLYQKSGRASTADETVERISSDMYFFPHDDQVLLFGRGGSGRSEDYVIKADPGPTLNLHNLGIIFVLIVYTYCFLMIRNVISLSKLNLFLSLAVASVLLTIMIIDAKVMYLFARQSWSIMLIAFYVFYAFYDASSPKYSRQKIH